MKREGIMHGRTYKFKELSLVSRSRLLYKPHTKHDLAMVS